MKKEKKRASYDTDVTQSLNFLTRRNFFHISAVAAARKGFPKDLAMKKGNVPTPFPILIDEDRKLTKGLGLFTSEWGGSKVDQLMPSVFILDKEGMLQFKYIAQNTWDRPGYEYPAKILGMINKGIL